MRILVLSIGDPDTWDSWSGSAKSLVDHLRAGGHDVICRDVELTGIARISTALKTYSPNRRRWWTRYHLGRAGFAARTRRATKIAQSESQGIDVILQIGATFVVKPLDRVLYVLFCDSNIDLANAGAASGFSDAAVLTSGEMAGVRAREADVYESAAGIFTMSDRLRRSFLEDFGIPPERVTTVHAGPNFEIGREPDVPDRSEGGPPVILFIGRDFERKGGLLLLDAFQEVRAEIPDARLLVVGPDRPTDLPASVGQDGIEWFGFLDKRTEEGRARLHEAYSRASVFCLPTRFEPFGIVFLEAMHYELPCVGPNAWAVPEIIDDGITGRLVIPDDRDSLANALKEILRDPVLAREMGRSGKVRLTGHFVWSKVADRMLSGLRVLMNSRTRGMTP